MTDYVNPSNNFRPLSEEMGRVFRYAGHAQSYIADGTTLVSDVDSVGVNAGPLNSFAKVSESGLDLEIDTGEAMVQGAILARDTRTTVTLPANSAGTIFLAWDPSVESTIIIDTEASGNVSELPQTPLYDFETDGSSIVSDTNQRALGEMITTVNSRYETPEGNGIAVDEAIEASVASNAANLGGNSPGVYARIDQDEDISGQWSIQSASSVTSRSFLLDRGGYGFNFSTGGPGDERPFIAPYVNGSSRFGREITWNEGSDQWEIEGHVALPNGTISNERGVNMMTGDPDQGHIFQGSSSPSDSLGRDGDIFVEY